jgi:hypothetical protein
MERRSSPASVTDWMSATTVADDRPSLKIQNDVSRVIDKVTFTAGNPELSRVAEVEIA